MLSRPRAPLYELLQLSSMKLGLGRLAIMRRRTLQTLRTCTGYLRQGLSRPPTHSVNILVPSDPSGWIAVDADHGLSSSLTGSQGETSQNGNGIVKMDF